MAVKDKIDRVSLGKKFEELTYLNELDSGFDQ